MLERIEHRGKLVPECHLPGERRDDLVAPAHPNGMQLSRNRFLILNATLGFRSVDDSRSTTWQLRRDGYDGPVIKEGFFSRTTNDWDPFDLGVTWKKETGAMHGFGVPKGARINGRRVPHENVFVCKFRTCAREYVPDGHYIRWWSRDNPDIWRSHMVRWVQFRLTDDEDDIEVLRPERRLRQVGYEQGNRFCERSVGNLNQTFARAWPLNRQCSEWVDVHHGSPGDHADMLLFTSRYRFNSQRGLYEWIQCGPPIGDGLYEASILPCGDDWLIAGRRRGHVREQRRQGVAWTRLNDPFGEVGRWTVPDDVKSCDTPITAYLCPDGAVRLISGDGSLSPYADPDDPMRWSDNRNPLYIWEIAPEDGFRATDRKVVFDMRAAGVPITPQHGPVSDMGKILPHTGGRTQTLVHRVRSCALRCDQPAEELEEIVTHDVPYLTEEDFEATGIYYARLHYEEDLPAEWTFE